jgi:hypothetical protein
MLSFAPGEQFPAPQHSTGPKVHSVMDLKRGKRKAHGHDIPIFARMSPSDVVVCSEIVNVVGAGETIFNRFVVIGKKS